MRKGGEKAYRASPLRQRFLCLQNVRHLVSPRRVVLAWAPPRDVTFVVVVDDDEGDDGGSKAKGDSSSQNLDLIIASKF